MSEHLKAHTPSETQEQVLLETYKALEASSDIRNMVCANSPSVWLSSMHVKTSHD